jgi:predicted DNA-binding protein (MmcQ/YjbR family)
MDFEALISLAFELKGTQETYPFGPQNLVLKVGNKMYAIMDIENPKSINLKCDPERAIELRETYSGVIEGYHMNKKHWNTVELNSDVPDKLMLELVQHSYQLVVDSLSKKEKEILKNN